MKKYHVIISKVAAKELRKFPKDVIGKIYAKMLLLSDDPRPNGCVKLEGFSENLWRVRVGDYRIIYSIEDTISIVEVRHVGDRKDIYK